MKKKLLLIPLAILLVVSLIACAAPAPAPAPAPTTTVTAPAAPAATVTAPAATVTAPAPVPAPEFKFVFAQPVSDIVRYEAIYLFQELLKTRSNGRVQFDFMGHGQLGTVQSLIDDVSSGVLEMDLEATGAFVRFVPWLGITDLPFVFETFVDALRWQEDVLIPEWNKDMASFNMMVLPNCGSAGASGIYSAAGPIHSTADLKGKIYRSWSPGVEVMYIEAMSAKAVVMPWEELFTALESGVVDIMHNPPAYSMEYGFYEVCKDFTVTNHKFWADQPIVNLEWWNSLPDDVQTLILETWATAANEWKWKIEDLHYRALEDMQKPPYNMNVYFPSSEDFADFKASMSPVFQWARDEYGDEKVDLLLKYVR